MDKYIRGCLLGKGSFGAAYLATERATGKKYVLKEISLNRMTAGEKKGAMQEADVSFLAGCSFVLVLFDRVISCDCRISFTRTTIAHDSVLCCGMSLVTESNVVLVIFLGWRR
jgi:serine/threonine protein kinase